MTSPTLYEVEIRELHDFFAAWFRGEVPNNDATFARFADAMAPDFTMITPHARAVRTRADILNGVRGGYGSRPDVRIWVEEVRVLHTLGEGVVVAYIEKQTSDGRETARRSTVVFTPAADAPGGLLWRHVHETWVADA